MYALKIVVPSLVVVGVAWWCGWFETFHWVTGGAALALGFIAALLWRRSRQQDWDENREAGDAEGADESPFRALGIGVLSGLVVSVYLGLVFAGAGRSDSLVGLFYDGDRNAFEARLGLLVQAGQHDQISQQIQARLEKGRVSRRWRSQLLQRQSESMVEAACQVPASPDRLSRLEAAAALAIAHGLDARRVEALVAREREWDQARLELERLRAARDWPQLTASLRFVVSSRSRLDWVVPADQWLYEAYVAWARDTTDLHMRQERLELALQTAADYGLDATAAKTVREATEQQANLAFSVQRARDQATEAARSEAGKEIAQLRAQQVAAEAAREREQAAATAALEQRDRDAAAKLDRAAVEVRYRTLLEAGDSLNDPTLTPTLSDSMGQGARLVRGSSSSEGGRAGGETQPSAVLQEHGVGATVGRQRADPRHVLEQQIQLYAAALGVAQANGIEPQPAATRLERAREELRALLARVERESRPADLPRGARVQILCVGTDRFPPGLDVGVAVDDAQGQPVGSLVAKDFRVTCSGEVLTNLGLAPVLTEPPPLHVVVALDVSGSMAGKPLKAAIAAAQAMIRSLASEPRVRVKVLSFSGKVQVRCPWTSDLEQAAQSVAGMAAAGQTALFAAVESALAELKACAGDRRLVVLSDGKDSQPSRSGSLSDLLVRLCEAKVAASVIGLETSELDRPTLERLAAETGGSYHHAVAPEEVATRFAEARRQLRREFYRLLLTPSLPVGTRNFEVRVEVGGENRAADQRTVRREPGAAVAAR